MNINRLLSQAICMTGSDLNSSSKPWPIQHRTSKVVYEEFHDQVSQKGFKLKILITFLFVTLLSWWFEWVRHTICKQFFESTAFITIKLG